MYLAEEGPIAIDGVLYAPAADESGPLHFGRRLNHHDGVAQQTSSDLEHGDGYAPNKTEAHRVQYAADGA
jgi:hypothetical protein